MARKNFFLLLGMNPDEAWDVVKFEQILKEKISQWTKDSTHPTRGSEANANRQLVPQIREVMNDPAKQEAERREAKTQGAAQAQQKRELFAEQLKLQATNTFILKERVDQWEKDLAGVMPRAEIERQIAALKVPILEKAPVAASRPQLEPAMARNIRTRLDQLGQRSLYTLLQTEVKPTLVEGSRRPDLEQAAKELYLIVSRNANKTPELTMKSELAGYAQDIFKTDEQRARYDETLRQERMEAIIAKYSEVGKTSHALNAKQVEQFLIEARQAGYSVEEAKQRLIKLAQDKKWMVAEPASSEAINRSWVCGKCDQLNDETAQRCTNDGEAKQLPCPNCGNAAKSADNACGSCGFPVGARFVIAVWADEAERLQRAHQLAEARAKLEEAQREWQPRQADPLAQRLQQLYQTVLDEERRQRAAEERQRVAASAAQTRLQELIRTKRFFEAQTFLQGVATGTIPNPKFAIDQIDDALRRARESFAKTTQVGLRPEERERLLEQVLTLCADYPGVAEELRRIKPAPPRDLRITLLRERQRVDLTWTASTAASVTGYRIVRKRNARPNHPNDGTVIATVAQTRYDDLAVPTGVMLFYAVYAVRALPGNDDICSDIAAVGAEAVLISEPVIFPTTTIGSNSIEISWGLPEGMQRVEVIRKEGREPTSDTDGILLPLDNPLANSLRDTSVQNGKTYFYRFIAIYRDDAGREFRAVRTEAITPERQPRKAELTRWEIKQEGGTFRAELAWSPPEFGDVTLIRSDHPPTLVQDKSIRLGLIDSYGTVLRDLVSPYVDTVPRVGIYYYTPLTCVRPTNQAYIGATQRVVCAEEVSDLSYVNVGNAIQLRWKWPTGSQVAVVASARNAFPVLDLLPGAVAAATISRAEVTRAEYEARGGHYDIPFSGGEDLFIVVGVRVQVEGKPVISSGKRLQIRLQSMVRLEYRFISGNPPKLILQPRPNATLPPFFLRAKRGSIPLNRQDGDPLKSFAGGASEGQYDLSDLRALPSRSFGKLFLENEDDYDWVKVLHPDEKGAKLN